jgi:hypothetical protein
VRDESLHAARRRTSPGTAGRPFASRNSTSWLPDAAYVVMVAGTGSGRAASGSTTARECSGRPPPRQRSCSLSAVLVAELGVSG